MQWCFLNFRNPKSKESQGLGELLEGEAFQKGWAEKKWPFFSSTETRAVNRVWIGEIRVHVDE